MKQKLSAIYPLVTLWLAISCLSTTDTKNIPTFDLQLWKTDSKGCTGVRRAQIDSLDQNFDWLLGNTEREIKSKLGQPPAARLYVRGQKFFTYPIACNIDSTAVEELRVRFNALGYCNEVMTISVKQN